MTESQVTEEYYSCKVWMSEGMMRYTYIAIMPQIQATKTIQYKISCPLFPTHLTTLPTPTQSDSLISQREQAQTQ